MRKIRVYFSDRQYEYLTGRAEMLGVSYAEMMRRFMDEMFDMLLSHGVSNHQVERDNDGQ